MSPGQQHVLTGLPAGTPNSRQALWSFQKVRTGVGLGTSMSACVEASGRLGACSEASRPGDCGGAVGEVLEGRRGRCQQVDGADFHRWDARKVPEVHAGRGWTGSLWLL